MRPGFVAVSNSSTLPTKVYSHYISTRDNTSLYKKVEGYLDFYYFLEILDTFYTELYLIYQYLSNIEYNTTKNCLLLGYATIQVITFFFYRLFERSLSCSPRLHLHNNKKQ